jgi:branched-chain amino acid transport system permease protein
MFEKKKFSMVYYSILIVITLLLALIPFMVTGSIVPIIYEIFMWIALAQSFNIISGYTGYVSFGHIAFYGTTATITAILVGLGIPILLSIPIGGIGAVLLAAGIGYPTLKLHGAYFAIAMLSISEAMAVIVLYLYPYGITLPPGLYDPLTTYYLMFALAISAIIVTYFISKSKFGLALISIRENEDAAAATGVNVFKYKMIAFMISALIAGLAGGIAVWRATYTEAAGAYGVEKTIEMIAMSMFGGAGTVTGPVFGATVLYALEYILWVRLPFLHLIIFGILIAATVLFIPKGVIGVIRNKFPKTRKILK